VDIEKTFKYHAPKPGQPERYEGLRNAGKRFAQLIDSFCPAGREKSLAFTHLQTAVMFANAAIAINEETT
jgi:hypothetical protein